MLFILKNWRSIIYTTLSGLVCLYIGYNIGNMFGVERGEDKCEKAQLVAAVVVNDEKRQSRDETDLQVNRLKLSDVERLLDADGWLRGD